MISIAWSTIMFFNIFGSVLFVEVRCLWVSGANDGHDFLVCGNSCSRLLTPPCILGKISYPDYWLWALMFLMTARCSCSKAPWAIPMFRAQESSFYLLSSRSTRNLEGRLEMKNSLTDYYPIIIGVAFSLLRCRRRHSLMMSFGPFKA